MQYHLPLVLLCLAVGCGSRSALEVRDAGEEADAAPPPDPRGCTIEELEDGVVTERSVDEVDDEGRLVRTTFERPGSAHGPSVWEYTYDAEGRVVRIDHRWDDRHQVTSVAYEPGRVIVDTCTGGRAWGR